MIGWLDDPVPCKTFVFGNAIKQILSSIAMEGLARSHIFNAEGEKLQYAAGALNETSGQALTFEQILQVSDSVHRTLEVSGHMLMLSMQQLSNALKSKENTLCEKHS